MRSVHSWALLCVELGACRPSTTESAVRASATASASAASASAASSATASGAPASPRTVTLFPGGIGFDDLVFANATHKVLAPGGATGTLALIDPKTLDVVSLRVASLPASTYVAGRHDAGITSAAQSADRIYASDRTSTKLRALKLDGAIDVEVALASPPDYVRYVAPTNEIWVTEPEAAQIEVFTCCTVPGFTRIAKIAVPGGPESLVVSASRRAAYANLWHQKSVEIDLSSHAIRRTFDTGCDKTRGIALDEGAGALFVACNDGDVKAVDIASGKIIARGHAGDGVDIIDWSPSLQHLYVPASRSGTMTIFSQTLTPLQTVSVPKGAHCVVADDSGQAWVCDPDHGSVIAFTDTH
jgi:hypothetical protein